MNPQAGDKSLFGSLTREKSENTQDKMKSLNDKILRMDLTELRLALDSNEISSEQLVMAYLEQIEINNKSGKKINAVITLNSDAINDARSWDESHIKDSISPSLAGIPYLVKDNINTKGIITSGGSVALAHNVPDEDAYVVKKLKEQGAVLLGKTNLSELSASYLWFGHSSFGGQTLNPCNPKRNASGSSTGSASAVAANFAPFALGTDTSGSIREPANVTGTVGFRPSFGLTSRSGTIPLSMTVDVTGAITRTVMDQVIVLNAIMGKDERDIATYSDAPMIYDLLKDFKNTSYENKKIAVINNFIGGNPDVDRVRNEVVEHLKSSGVSIDEIDLPDEYEDLFNTVLGPICLSEFRPQFDRYLSTTSGQSPKNSSEFIKVLAQLTLNGKTLINPARYEGLVDSIESTSVASAEYIYLLTRKIPSLRLELTKILKSGGYDAFMFPTMSCPASTLPGVADSSYICHSTDPSAASYIASATGFPQITVPAGLGLGNIPIGISFMGLHGEDKLILQMAYLFENNF